MSLSLSHSACLLGSGRPVCVFSLCLYLSITFLTQFAWFHHACSYFWLYVSLFVTLPGCHPACMSVSVCVCLLVWLSGASSLCLSVGLFGCLGSSSLCLSAWVPNCLFIHLSVSVSACLPASRSLSLGHNLQPCTHTPRLTLFSSATGTLPGRRQLRPQLGRGARPL